MVTHPASSMQLTRLASIPLTTLWIPLLDTVLLLPPNQAINHSNIATSYHYYYYYYIPKRRHCISSWVPSFQRKITETSNRDRILIQPHLAVHTSESSIPSQDIILRSRARNQAKFSSRSRRPPCRQLLLLLRPNWRKAGAIHSRIIDHHCSSGTKETYDGNTCRAPKVMPMQTDQLHYYYYYKGSCHFIFYHHIFLFFFAIYRDKKWPHCHAAISTPFFYCSLGWRAKKFCWKIFV